MADGMKIFSLFGDIFIKDDDANSKLDKMDKKANTLNVSLKGMSSDAGKSIRQINKDFEVWSVQTDKAGNSQEYLRKKLESLNKIMDISNKELEKQKEAYKEAVQKYGENSSVAEKLKRKIQDLEIGHAKLAKQIDETKESLSKAENKFEQYGKKIVDVTDKIAKWGMGIMAAGAAAGAALLKVAESSAEAAQEINVMSERTGISVQRLQEWKYAAEQTGVELDRFNDGIENLSGVIGDVMDGSEDAVAIFKELGVSIKDMNGKLRNQGDVYQDIIMKLADMDDKTRRNIIGSKLFGDSFLQLTPFLNQGSEGIAKLAKQAHELGLIMSDETIKAADEFVNKLNALKSSGEAAKNQIGIALIPVFEELVDKIINNMPKIQEYVGKAGEVVNDVVSFGLNYLPEIIGLVEVLTSVWLIQKGVLAALAINKALDWTVTKLIAFETAAATKGTIAYTVAQKANSVATGIATGINTVFGTSLTFTGTQLLVVAAAITVVVGLILLLTKGFSQANEEINRTINSTSNLNNIKIPNVNSKYGVPGFASGISYVPGDMLAVIHKGEAVIPARYNPFNPDADRSMGNIYIEHMEFRADDVKDIIDIKDFFDRIKQKSRQGVR